MCENESIFLWLIHKLCSKSQVRLPEASEFYSRANGFYPLLAQLAIERFGTIVSEEIQLTDIRTEKG